MAQENERASRARKTTESEPGAAADKPTRARARKTPAPDVDATEAVAAEVTKNAPKSTVKATGAKTTPRRTRKASVVAELPPETIAERAYLLWERGEHGDQTEHWLRAEAELRAA